MKLPLGIALNKEKMFAMSNGTFHMLNSPILELIAPVHWDKNNDYKMMEDEYYFIGLSKWKTSEPGAPTNGTNRAVVIPMDHIQWNERYGKSLPFSYTDYMLITKKDELKKHNHKGKIKLMYWDIEVCSDGSGIFPKPTKNAVAMIGYKMVEYDHDSSSYTDLTDIEIIESFDKDDVGKEDKQILLDFIDAMDKHNPHVIVGYNSWKFDLPYILKRMEMLAIDGHKLTGIPEWQCQKYKNVLSHYRHAADPENDFNQGVFGSRIHYDIFPVDVIRDGNLTGLKDRKMKTIAQKFYPDDEEIIVLEEGIENIYSMMLDEKKKDELRKYLRSDIIQTERISTFYFATNVEQAEQLEVPLSTIINRANGTIPTLYLLTEMLANKMIPLRPNSEVFEPLTQRAMVDFNEKKFFQGAYVDIFKTGKMPHPIYKVDFKSLYPNTIRTYNISYETVQTEFELIEGEVSDDLDTYEMSLKDNILTLVYNDKVLHVRATVRIDQRFRGLVPRIMDKILTDRANVKASMRDMEQGSIEYMQADSRQLFLKIVANSAYGILSQRTGIGYLPMGMTITAMGRWATKIMTQEINKKDTKLLATSQQSEKVSPQKAAEFEDAW